MKTSELKDYLELWYKNSMANPTQCVTPLLESSPGIGKTQIVKQFAADKGVNCLVLDLSQANPSEVCGMDIPDYDTGTIKKFDPAWVGTLKPGDIVFLDEIKKAPPAVWNACLIMINERVMPSGTELPPIAIIAASNPGKGNFTPEQKQRFRLITVSFDRKAWADYVNDTLGVRPGVDLMDMLQFPVTGDGSCDSRLWNYFTPREAYKDLLWLCQAETEEELTEIYDKCIRSLWTSGSRNTLLYDCAFQKFKRNISAKRKELEEILNANGYTEIVVSYRDRSDLELLNYLSAHGILGNLFEGVNVALN